MKKINKKATLGVGLAMFALADPTQVFNFNNSTLDSTVIKVEAQTSYVSSKNVKDVTVTDGTKGSWNEEETAFYVSDSLANGLVKIGTDVYYFNNGVIVTGLVDVNGTSDSKVYKFYFDEEGKAVTGLVTINDDTYYFGTDGKMVISQVVNDTETEAYYSFDSEGKMITSKIVEISGTASEGKVTAGSSKLTEGFYCFGEDGKLVQSGFGVAVDEEGNTNTYYVDPKGKTKQIVKKLLVSADDSIYYFDTDGKMVTGVTSITFDSGSQTLNKVKYSDGTYYFNESGEMQTGLINVSKIEDYDDAGLYYFGANGAAVEGWQVIDSNRYYFRKDSDLESKYKKYTAVVDGEVTLNTSEIYRFDENGVMVTGFYTDSTGTYYYSEETLTLGQKIKGKTVKINGVDYNFDTDGKMVTGFTKDGKFYFDNQGQLVTGWFTVDGKTYYAAPEKVDSIEKGEIRTGFVEIDGTKYYFSTGKDSTKGLNGQTATKGEMLKGIQKISNKNYFLGENTGRVVTGWVTADKDGKNYYMDENGVIQTKWITINDSTYYLADSTMAKSSYITEGEMLTDLQEINGNTYYFGNDGVMRVGFQNVNGSIYYFDEQYSSTPGVRGKRLSVESGITEINGEEYYLDKNGEIVTGWLTIGNTGLNDGTTYYMNSRGIVQKGWQTIDGTTYYFDKTSGALSKGIKEINGDYYFFGENTGRLVTGLVTADAKDEQGNRKVFYMNERGVIQTGFVTIDGTTYYFSDREAASLSLTDTETKGQMLRGIQTINEKNYFLGENTGRLVTGWVTADMKDSKGNNIIFYMNERGEIQTGFQTIDGTTYYFSQSTNTDMTKLVTGSKDSIDLGEIHGQMLKGIQEIGAKGSKVTYFLGENTGRVVTGLITADMKDKNGNNMIFYMNGKGVIQTGFKTINGTTYYFSKGVKTNDSGEKYGQMLKGIQTIDKVDYFLGENTGRVVTGWVTADKDGRRYYMDEYGKLTKGKLKTIDGKKYYFNEKGQMEVNTAYKAEDGKIYIIDENGVATEQKKA